MQEETTSNNTSKEPNAKSTDSASFAEAIGILGAFGDLIEKVAKCATGDSNSDVRQCIRMIWATNKDTIKQKFPEIKHLDVDPVNGYLFAAIDDEVFDNLSVSRLKSIKHYLYESANAEDKQKVINAYNFKLVVDNYSNYGKCDEDKIIV